MIETKRLLLRRLAKEDVDQVYSNYSTDDDEFCYTHIPHPYEKKDAIGFIDRSIKANETGTGLRLAIILKDHEKLIGEIVAKHLDNEDDCVEVGYSLTKDSRNKGIITEAAQALIGHLFKNCGVNRVEMLCSVNNEASRKVMKKLGAVHEGIAREAAKLRGKYHDEHQYSILKREWKVDS